MEFKILQTNNRNYSFMDYEWAIAHGFSLDDYKEVYKDDFPKAPEEVDYYNILDTLFEIFNIRRPKDYKARSMSTSDIVVLGEKKFYCDSFGWKEL